MKPKTKMGQRHPRCVWYDDSSKQSGGGQASIWQRHNWQRRPDDDMLREEEEEDIDIRDVWKALLQTNSGYATDQF